MKRNLVILIGALLLVSFATSFASKNSTTKNPSSKSETSRPPSKTATFPAQSKSKPTPSKLETKLSENLYEVKRVVDGDTIELSTGEKVRYIGINTPETVDPRTTVQCFGKEASDKNKELVEGKKVRLEKDVSETDKYGRLLRYVYLDNNLINLTLVKEGYAYASSYPPDVKFQALFKNAQTEAQTDNKGLWATCEAGQVLNSNQTNSSLNTCLIKGNISSAKEKIYHLPGQKYYAKTVIDTSKGERWFCSESEAISAGWRKSKI